MILGRWCTAGSTLSVLQLVTVDGHTPSCLAHSSLDSPRSVILLRKCSPSVLGSRGYIRGKGLFALRVMSQKGSVTRWIITRKDSEREGLQQCFVVRIPFKKLRHGLRPGRLIAVDARGDAHLDRARRVCRQRNSVERIGLVAQREFAQFFHSNMRRRRLNHPQP